MHTHRTLHGRGELGTWLVKEQVHAVLELQWSDTQSDTPDVADTHTDWDLGIGTWLKVNEYTNVKFNINGLRDSVSQTITAGFHHKLQNDVTVGAFGSVLITHDVSGFGIRLTIGRNL